MHMVLCGDWCYADNRCENLCFSGGISAAHGKAKPVQALLAVGCAAGKMSVVASFKIRFFFNILHIAAPRVSFDGASRSDFDEHGILDALALGLRNNHS